MSQGYVPKSEFHHKVIAKENEYISARRLKAEREAAPGQSHEGFSRPVEGGRVNRRPIGLAFSGGGIRSASFNLGLVQALAAHGILPWVDYLSSVSGGGLIAGCMTSLLSQHDAFTTQWESFPFNPQKQVFALNPDATKDEDEIYIPLDETQPGKLKSGHNLQLVHLRDKGNYLIPRRGIFNRDSLRGVGAIVLGVSYTLTIFLLALVVLSLAHYSATAAMSPSVLGEIAFTQPQPPQAELDEDQGAGQEGKTDVQDTVVIFRLFDQEIRLDSDQPVPQEEPAGVKHTVQDLLFRDYRAGSPDSPRPFPWRPFLFCFLLGALCSLLIFLLLVNGYIYKRCIGGFLYRKIADRWTKNAKLGLAEQEYIDKQAIHLMIIVPFLCILLLSILALKVIFHSDAQGPQIFWIWLPSAFALGSWCVLVFLRFLGLKFDGDKEPKPFIWSNADFRTVFWAWHGLGLYALIGFLVFALLALPHFFTISPKWGQLVPYATLASTASSALLSYISGKENDDGNPLTKVITRSPTMLKLVLGFLVLVANLSLIFLFQIVIDRTVPNWSSVTAFNFLVDFVGEKCLDVATVLVLLALATLIFAALVYVVGRLVNFNYISPHYFARDRIADAYLKTEVSFESGPKTGMVKTVHDYSSTSLHEIHPHGTSAPYHLIVTALNLPGSWHMRYKDRKSEHFIFSKYFCGSHLTGYVESERYRQGLTKYSRAIAISGAAASSALGYLTFFAQAFVMTLFNVRLGLWVTNPLQHPKAWKKIVKNDRDDEKKKYNDYMRRLEETVFWPHYLWAEARGATDERDKMVNLTDGGHTGDNGALYPLFQRRCEVIIAGDASRDRNFTCRDLFRVLHQVKTELDIDVTIDVSDLKPEIKDDQQPGPSKCHFALGKIIYPEDKQRGLSEQTGLLLYFKPAMTGREPDTVKHYHEIHKDQFPHTTTIDQFFDEEQFEAYRHLGELSVKDALEKLPGVDEEQLAHSVEQSLRNKGLPRILDDFYCESRKEKRAATDGGVPVKIKGLLSLLKDIVS